MRSADQRVSSGWALLYALMHALSGAGLPAQITPPDPPPDALPRPADRFEFTRSENIPIPSEAEGSRPLELSLEDALRLAENNNVDLLADRLGPRRSLEDVILAKAFYDPELYADVGRRSTRSPSTSPFAPELEREIYDARIGWRKRALLTNSLIDVNFAWNRLEQSVTTVSGFPATLYETGFGLTFTQPLLRSGWGTYARTSIQRAESLRDNVTHAYDQDEQDILIAVVRAYWELVFAREDYRVQYQALELAREQLRITRARIAVRDLAPRDAVADEAEVARRQEILITADNQIQQRADNLRALIFRDAQGEMWNWALTPTSPFVSDLDVSALEWGTHARIAMEHRPDLLALRANVEVATQELIAAEQDLLPLLDLVGSYHSGSSQPSSTGDAFRDALDQDYPDWSLRLQFAYPIGNRAARAFRDRAELNLEEARRRVHAQEVEVRRQVREAVRSLKTLAESIRAARESVRLAENDLDTARHRQRVGTLTLFDVQERNQLLQEARSRLLRNQLDFRTAAAVLRHVQGLLVVPEGGAAFAK